MQIRKMQEAAWESAESKGFHHGWTNSREETLVRLCLIHSEVSEAVQEVKRHWVVDPPPSVKLRVAEELADILIRCGDLAHSIGVDLQSAVILKMDKNLTRPAGYGTPHEGEERGI